MLNAALHVRRESPTYKLGLRSIRFIPVSVITDLASRAGSAAQSLWEASGQLDPAFPPPRRHGSRPLRQDGLHHRSRASSDAGHEPSCFPRLRRGADPAGASCPSARRRGAALSLRGAYGGAHATSRRWPQSTNRISELRVDVEYERKAGWRTGPASLALDIVDYPGEWLLDLALLEAGYAEWSQQTIEAQPQARPGAGCRALARGPDNLRSVRRLPTRCWPPGRARPSRIISPSCAPVPEAVATTPPGRFLMPGDLAGSPALTFAPLDLPQGQPIAPGSFAALMERRFEAYKTHVVRPFFRDHFQRIDRQIVLVDVLAAIDAGPVALAELEEALDQVLMAFRTGRNTLAVAPVFAPRRPGPVRRDEGRPHPPYRSRPARRRPAPSGEPRGAPHGGRGRAGRHRGARLRARHPRDDVREGRETLRAVAGVPEAGERVGG